MGTRQENRMGRGRGRGMGMGRGLRKDPRTGRKWIEG